MFSNSSSSSSSSSGHNNNALTKQRKTDKKKSWFKSLALRKKSSRQMQSGMISSPEIEEIRQQHEEYLNKVPENWMNPNIPASAPEIQPDSSLHTISFYVASSLTLVSRNPIRTASDLLQHLELFVDHYSGSRLMYPYYSLIYILLGAKLRSTNSTSSLFSYKSEFIGVLRLGTFTPDVDLQMGKFTLRMTEGRGQSHYSVVLEIFLSHSNRSGKTYPDWYKMGDNNFPFTTAAELLSLNLAIDDEGILGPV